MFSKNGMHLDICIILFFATFELLSYDKEEELKTEAPPGWFSGERVELMT